MFFEENQAMGNSPSQMARAKEEPAEPRVLLGQSSSSHALAAPSRQDQMPARVKTELNDAVNRFLGYSSSMSPTARVLQHQDVQSPLAQGIQTSTPHPPQDIVASGTPASILPFKEYASPNEIDYSPENALKEGTEMAQHLKTRMTKMKLGSRLREEVWNREFENLKSQASPTTLIAVCGATGAGKSSILNAILDDNIVPTSGMRACTAVVTEISYHKKPTINAEVSFLSLAEWKAELALLLHDLIDEDGNLKRSADLKSEAGIAWSKVNAVYPAIRQEQLVYMSVEQIIAHNPDIANILGTVKEIVAKDSHAFAKEIAKYVDSKDQKRDSRKTKRKEKHKHKKKNLTDSMRAAVGRNSRNSDQASSSISGAEPALWPLIRQVKVRCRAAPLSTGAILVDLPGVADANAARNNIAKDYMKKCNCIWILAPITRAVDDKTARDLLGDAFKLQLKNGNYDDHTITFIATKCDDVSCSEVIHALHLDFDPELEDIELRIEENEEETLVWKRCESEAKKEIKVIEKEMESLGKIIDEYEEHLTALENGQTFSPSPTRKKSSKAGEKRKNKDKSNASKRRRTTLGSDTDDSDSPASEDSSDSIESEWERTDSSHDTGSEDSSGSGSSTEDSESEGDTELVTPKALKAKIRAEKERLKELRSKRIRARKKKRDAFTKLARLKKSSMKVQREKNAFCSLKRSEFSRDVLKEDFRAGLKDLDDAAAEERDPTNFDPTVDLRNYAAIDLPVFTCSSRDYVRIKRQVKGDGEPTCFTNVEDTGIPDLQRWCQQLTAASQEHAARNFLYKLKALMTGVDSYIRGISEVTAADRAAFRARWESNGELTGFYSGEATIIKGVAAELVKKFIVLTDNCTESLQTHFRDGLEGKCLMGAANAAAMAVQTSDEFARGMHWTTYRATLRRHGCWRRDLNAELTLPFTRTIASSWGNVFETDVFTAFEIAVMLAISELLEEIEASAPAGLKDRTRCQGELCLEEARIALQQIVNIARETLSIQQKEISRIMAPHVQDHLIRGYDQAMEERGAGSVSRQKAVFLGFVGEVKDDIFKDGAEVIMSRLASVANAIGAKLDEALNELAQKVEVNISVLWEAVRDDPGQTKARQDVVDTVHLLLRQIAFWLEASKPVEQGDSQTTDADGDIEMNNGEQTLEVGATPCYTEGDSIHRDIGTNFLLAYTTV